MSACRSAIIAPILVLFNAITWAETTSLPLWDDAWIRASMPDKNYGDYNSMRVNRSGGQQTLVRFDAAAISGQPISRATLKLHVTAITNDGDISIHAITSSWDETNVTWNLRPPSEATAVAMRGIPTLDPGTQIYMDVTDVVKRWADGSLPDAGLLIKTSDISRAYFLTKEGATEGRSASELEVQTGPPELMVDRITVLDGYMLFGDRHNRTSWETEVIIPGSVLLTAKSAHISFYTIDATLGRLVINGQVLQMPDSSNIGGPWRAEIGQTLLSFPLGFLQPGANTVRFEAGMGNWAPDNRYDDYEFGDVEIILSRR